MKEKFEIFKNEKIVINVRSQKQYDEFMKMCEKQGLKWRSWDLPTKNNYYNECKEETCINLNYLKELSYFDIDFSKNEGYKIITYKDFIKEKSKQFTKSDLKDNHIVVYKNGNRDLWENVACKENYTENLIYKDTDIFSINEVYEFDKLVWKREEPILDEVEKRWLKHFIKSTKIKVKYIKKWLGASCENEYLQIVYDVFNHEYNEDRQGNLYLPIFKKGSMYKGLDLDKKYTLEELDL